MSFRSQSTHLNGRLKKLEALRATVNAKQPPTSTHQDAVSIEAYVRFVRGEDVPELACLSPYRELVEDMLTGKLGRPPEGRIDGDA